jgi:NhaA family Na+:H+ antiporter
VRNSPTPRTLVREFFQKFAALESASSLLLLACTLFALVWANTGWVHAYHLFRDLPLGFMWGGKFLGLPLELFVNDALMAVFFLLVGLEIKRELLAGELASLKRATLPILAALGGMLVPAALFIAWNQGLPGANGWGIPMATDIAFALGVMMLLGNRVPVGLKVFLVALAIIDDIGAILVIAIFYTHSLHLPALALAAAVFGGLLLVNKSGVRHPAPYLIGGGALWLCVFQSGVHATIAGVLLAFCIPYRDGAGMRVRDETSIPQLQRFESKLHPYVSFGILPLFALVNAGVTLSPTVLHALVDPLGLGIVTGLCLGKPIGITLFSWMAVRLRLATLPTGVSWGQLAGAGMLGGIGFTMSIFIAGLGLPTAELLDGAKIAILVSSVVAGTAGYLALRMLGQGKPS